MWLRSLLASLLVLMLLAPVRSADACGPDFPHRLLVDRAGTLGELPDGAFSLEATRLAPKPLESFRVMEGGDEPVDARTGGGARETELYEAGARAFTSGDAQTARARFNDVLALPAGERRHYSTFAAFMLGRNAGAGFEQDAQHGFERTRQLAREGFDDPLGLAVASLGEQARGLLRAGDDAGAIRLYAEQAAHGSGGAVTSLLMVARALARDEARLHAALKDPLAQRLMTTFVWTRGQEWYGSEDTSGGGLAAVLEALASVQGLAGADRLAAGAWRAGRFDLAERFAQHGQTPLAAWVKGKLALRRGDPSSAEVYLSEAARGLPASEDWVGEGMVPRRPLCRVEGERGVLALARGDFFQAAERMLASCSWPDLAYVAERVLSVDELQRFVAAHPPSGEERCKPEVGQLWHDDDVGEGADLSQRLRLLLARRLLRIGRADEALEHFRGTQWEGPARQYADALKQSTLAHDAVTQAEALFTAAKLARGLGLEMLGTEVAPDWGWVDGNYDLGTYEEQEELSAGAEQSREALSGTPLLGVPEQQRVQSHAPPYPWRFHYRSTAADLAQRGAALLPPRSQAYAMMLCHAARYVSSSEPERVQRLWQTYLKVGAAIDEPWWSFGHSCPEPDFEKVRAQQAQQALGKRQRLMMFGGALLFPAMLGAAFYLRRKRRATSP
ncbi:hypothetical protein FJV41_25085 [Myxococcus llanfairpwllgwyngyllgogerychwyrndrobwllllantysiliogogogochensis]|uniref:Uncharacterized protein n=1 Tax=Myxococcus llanfairpwllgwyngyllgogerychwyrndrobwllllantysiliogogogochensis TaxID=2590453 RepID=A0A540WW52_9BACT|nr:hypothetical protein [Myxococcus llanfairpwllgwyngyllgogerychwyrndrobwllllantysiliogogogochensis]TQF13217.1 hypothetical protein FJV41_25085 [Myxococcus llanfairpwllgwyngyllgogerychwyrndrobwllllantysiliogogogochensis]